MILFDFVYRYVYISYTTFFRYSCWGPERSSFPNPQRSGLVGHFITFLVCLQRSLERRVQFSIQIHSRLHLHHKIRLHIYPQQYQIPLARNQSCMAKIPQSLREFPNQTPTSRGEPGICQETCGITRRRSSAHFSCESVRKSGCFTRTICRTCAS